MSKLWSAPPPSPERQEWSRPPLETVRLHGIVASPWLRSVTPAVRGSAARVPVRPVPSRQVAWGAFRRLSWTLAQVYDDRWDRHLLWNHRISEDPDERRVGEALASPAAPPDDREMGLGLARTVFYTTGGTYADKYSVDLLRDRITDYLVATYGLHEALRITLETLYENPRLERFRDLLADLDDDAYDTAALHLHDAWESVLGTLHERRKARAFAPDSQLEAVQWAASYVLPVGSGAESIAQSFFRTAVARLRPFGRSIDPVVVACGGPEGFAKIAEVNRGAYHADYAYVRGHRLPLAAQLVAFGVDILPTVLTTRSDRSEENWWRLLAHVDHPDAFALLAPSDGEEDPKVVAARAIAAALHPAFREAHDLTAEPLPDPVPEAEEPSPSPLRPYVPPERPPGTPLPDGAPDLELTFDDTEQAALDEASGKTRPPLDEAWLAHQERWSLPMRPSTVIDQSADVVARVTRVGFEAPYGAWRALAQHGEPVMAALAGFDLSRLLDHVGPIGDVRLYPQLAEAFTKKSNKSEAAAWFRRHPRHAAWAAVRANDDTAGRVLRYLASQGQQALVETEAVAAGVDAAPILALDPLTPKVRKKLKLPSWLHADRLPELVDDVGQAATMDEVKEELRRFAVSNEMEPHPALLRPRWTASSRARFVWAVFETWLAMGAPAKEQWCLQALGFWGDDRIAQDLATMAARWPKEKAAKRAQWALPALGNIGTEVALGQIHALAETSRFPAFKEAARAQMQAVASRLGLTAEALADRLAPRLDLDHAGNVLDFGPRQFTLGFDEQGQPTVHDGTGKRLKSLPKPGKTDDAELASAALQRFKVLKKQTKTAAAVHVRRLERLMVSQRAIPRSTFQAHFQQHPWMTHLCRRLLWRTDSAFFRLDETGAAVDADDEPLDLGEHVVLPHPVQMAPDDITRWQQVWIDYELLSPFPQLHRPTAQATTEESASGELHRFDGEPLVHKALLGSKARGWRWSGGSNVDALRLAVDATCDVVLELDPGFYPGDPGDMDPQTVHATKLVGEPGPIAWSEAIAAIRALTEEA